MYGLILCRRLRAMEDANFFKMKIDKKIINILKTGGVGVLPTDTLYGLVGSAMKKTAVERIYQLKKRTPQKPFIILISDINDLKLFGVMLDVGVKKILKQFWPGPVSVILNCPNLQNNLVYLKPLAGTLAFRCPKDKWLHNLLKRTGPLVAPSANWEGAAPANNIEQAKRYFNDTVNFYLDAGELSGLPSTLIVIKDGKIEVLRQGKLKMKSEK